MDYQKLAVQAQVAEDKVRETIKNAKEKFQAADKKQLAKDAALQVAVIPVGVGLLVGWAFGGIAVDMYKEGKRVTKAVKTAYQNRNNN